MTRSRDIADSQDSLGGPVPPVVAGKNAVINGGFDIAQRGTSFTGLAGAEYALDRWVPWSTTGGQSNYASREIAGNLSVTPNQAIQYCMRVGRTAGTTNTGGRQLFHTIETSNSVRFAGKTVTFSFYARKGANYSSTDSGLQFYVGSGTGTDQIYYSFTGAAAVIATTNVTLTTSWQRFTATGTVATNATELAMSFIWSPTGTAGAADYLEITGVQLEEGSAATPFSRAGGTIQGELAACKRYYQKSYTHDTVPGTNTQVGLVNFISASSTNTTNRCWVPLQTTMRTASGSVTTYSVNGATNNATNEVIGNFTTAIQFQSENSFNLYATSGSFSAGQVCNFHYVISAEL